MRISRWYGAWRWPWPWCLVALGVSGLSKPLGGEDWPQWRGAERTGHVTPGARTPAVLPTEPRLVWRLRTGEGLASPVVADGRVFYFDNQAGRETLHAIDAQDSRQLWSAPIDAVFKDEQGPPGPRCTPIVDGDRIYAQSGLGELQCLSVASGRRHWRVNYRNDFGAAFLGEDSKIPGAAEHGYTASPLIAGTRLVACVGGTNGAGVVCFDKITGQVLWKSQNDLAAYAAPIRATLGGIEQAVCFTVEGLIGLGLDDGKLLWRVPFKTSYGRHCATPVAVNDWILAGSYRAGLIGVKVSSTGEGLKADWVWTNKALAMNFSSPVAVGRHLYGLGPTKNLFCAEVETGKLAWSKEGYFTTSADVAHASFIAMGEKILVATDGGELVQFGADPSGFRELGRVQVCGLNWCNPAYAGGRLYIRDGIKATGNLFCVELMP
ncbi:MAG: PQQ-binding-like beta-propeller repeat protein [Verrucomicrobiota bacterium]